MADRYWVGPGINWGSVNPTNWSETDGGPNNASVPVAGDSVYFRSNVDCFYSLGTPALYSIDMEGYTGALSIPTLNIAPSSGTGIARIVNIALYSTISLRLNPASGASVDLYLRSHPMTIIIGSLSSGVGTVNLREDFSDTMTSLTINRGVFVSNGYEIAATKIDISTTTTRTINIQDSVVTVGEGDWDVTDPTELTLLAERSHIHVIDDGIFKGGGMTYWDVSMDGLNQSITGSNTFNTLSINNYGASVGLKITAGTTQTLNDIQTNSYAGHLGIMRSSVNGSTYTISKPSGQISIDYMSIRDSVATGGASFYAGANSVNVSGNSGWIFSAPSGSNISKFCSVTRANIKSVDSVLLENIKHLAGV